MHVSTLFVSLPLGCLICNEFNMDWNGLMGYEYGMIGGDSVRRCPGLEDCYQGLLGL